MDMAPLRDEALPGKATPLASTTIPPVLAVAAALDCGFDHIFKEEFCCDASYAAECAHVPPECCAGFDVAASAPPGWWRSTCRALRTPQ